MSRRAPIDPTVQPALAIESTFDPHSLEAMRAAYDKLNYRRYGIEFEEAVKDDGLAICLRVTAEAIARQLQKVH